jgi:SAM-dependent methyltransferase
MSTSCPVCNHCETVRTVERARLPVLQNRVFATSDEARQSPVAPFALHTCAACGFSFNGLFDNSRVVYDAQYDNDVPSEAFRCYYEDLAHRLIERFALTEGTVYDVGCGKGTFLRVLCRLAPGIRGVGVDPSCQPVQDGNFSLVCDVFRPELLTSDARLILLRHVLEHVDRPVSFLSALHDAAPSAPLFVEVPQVDWILEHGAFWDFCYEHCNYFNRGSLAHAIARAGYEPSEHLALFGGQYQGAIGLPAPTARSVAPAGGATALQTMMTYASGERVRMQEAFAAVAAADGRAVIWGMATKGVIFATLVDAPLAGGVDANPKKQQRFAPGSGLQIHAPEWLATLGDAPTIVIMNSNYGDEIRQTVARLGVSARFVDL